MYVYEETDFCNNVQGILLGLATGQDSKVMHLYIDSHIYCNIMNRLSKPFLWSSNHHLINLLRGETLCTFFISIKAFQRGF